ncbi:MAG: DegT/DnrJ/EryC1/StrS family aminotransferase, partial [Planctomycetota bacterium]
PMTCTATNMPVLAAGAKIVWSDIDPWTGNIDPEDVKRKITKKTKAIICVHWGGYPCEMIDLACAADIPYEKGRPSIRIIEDAAHAFGSIFQHKFIGGYYRSRFTCFSFQAIKGLTTVDGGALTCKFRQDYDRGKLLRWYGIDRNAECKDLRCEEDIAEYGYKFHMNDVCATIGIEQLKYVQDILNLHRRNAAMYDRAFCELENVKLLRYEPGLQSSYWLYTIRVKGRDEFVKKMAEAGIMASKVHARNDLHSCFKDSRCDLPGVDEFYSEQVSIPVGWWVTEAEVKYIINEVIKYDESVKRDSVRHSGQLAGQLS